MRVDFIPLFVYNKYIIKIKENNMREYLDIASKIYGYEDSYNVKRSDHKMVRELARDLKKNDNDLDLWWVK